MKVRTLCYVLPSVEILSATSDAVMMAATDLPAGQKNITARWFSIVSSMVQGFMAIEASKALHGGATIEEAIAAAKSFEGRSYLYGALATAMLFGHEWPCGAIGRRYGECVEY